MTTTIPPFTLYHANCLTILKEMPDNSVDSFVCDPPYGLSKHQKGEVEDCLKAWLNGEVYAGKTTGFMGKKWDAWVPGPEIWKEALRVLKPGGHALIFAGTRSMDLMGMALRLSGFELRDSIGYAHDETETNAAPLMAWVYGTGFPKNQDIAKQLDKKAGATREILAEIDPRSTFDGKPRKTPASNASWRSAEGREDIQAINQKQITEPQSAEAKQWDGWGTALKPAWEPILIARKPFSGTLADNILKWGCGGLNINDCRIETQENLKGGAYSPRKVESAIFDTRGMHSQGACAKGDYQQPVGRWPANVIHDDSTAVMAQFPNSNGQQGDITNHPRRQSTNGIYGKIGAATDRPARKDAGSAARFFYCSKTSKTDRNEGVESLDESESKHISGLTRSIDQREGRSQKERQPTLHTNNHPTVKPTRLMRYLCRLVTPPGGTVVDLFMGSGSTGKAALLEGFKFIGMEQDLHSFAIAKARIQHAQKNMELKL